VGYASAGFTPGKINEGNNILEQYTAAGLAQANKRRENESAYCGLARLSLETMVTKGEIITLPGDLLSGLSENLQEELTQNRAGVFVSLHKNGQLRGCIGTIAPTTDNVALEIIQNAVSAGMSDNRFDPVEASELPFLTYKVDILSAPQAISSDEELDVKRYGIIVSSGNKRGLLLPNLEGIDSPKQQIDIARKKAGISEGEPIRLERFKVIRHE
jgi:AmmeMemoRadiSam system protein A